jgi:fermentation-respiration switch protein FrsA (DUF1100 family)
MKKIAPKRINFTSGKSELVGHLFQASPAPATCVVVTGSWTTVKEQMADLYAAKLAAAGFSVLTFDFSGWGESSGTPREYECPALKIADISAAAKWLSNQPFAAGPIGGLAICASAGYMAAAIGAGAPLSSFATVAAWLHDAGTIGEVYGGEEGVKAKMESGAKAREIFEKTGEVRYVPAYSDSDPDAGMGKMVAAYYGDPEVGAVPQWRNRLATLSWPDWLQFDGVATAPGVKVPTLMVHSEKAAFPDNARRFDQQLGGPHEMQWLQGAQIDFYYQPQQVDPAVAAVAKHLRETLSTTARRRA